MAATLPQIGMGKRNPTSQSTMSIHTHLRNVPTITTLVVPIEASQLFSAASASLNLSEHYYENSVGELSWPMK